MSLKVTLGSCVIAATGLPESIFRPSTISQMGLVLFTGDGSCCLETYWDSLLTGLKSLRWLGMGGHGCLKSTPWLLILFPEGHRQERVGQHHGTATSKLAFLCRMCNHLTACVASMCRAFPVLLHANYQPRRLLVVYQPWRRRQSSHTHSICLGSGPFHFITSQWPA